MMKSHGAVLRSIAAAAVALTFLVLPAAAPAARLMVTGHDLDHHCGRVGSGFSNRQCHFFHIAVDYVRAGAPDPSKPILALDRGKLDVVTSLDREYGAGVVPRVVIDPRSDAFKTAPITTDLYSAVIIASSGGDPGDASQQDLNELASTPDSDAINARAGDLRAFFDAGGGLLVNAGNVHGDSPSDPYYAFLPLAVVARTITPPYALTDLGRSMGIADADVMCCPTHNVFEPAPAGSPLTPVDLDASGRVATFVAETQTFAALGEPPVTQAVVDQAARGLPTTGNCVRRTRLSLKVRRVNGFRFKRARVFLNGKLVRRLSGKRVTRRFRVRVPATANGTIRVRIVVRTAGKHKVTIRRKYTVCA